MTRVSVTKEQYEDLLAKAHRCEMAERELAALRESLPRLKLLLQLETAALEQACSAPVDAPLTTEQARTWRPIETAPKDGTDVILLFPREDEMFKSEQLLPRRRAANWFRGAWSVPHFTGNMPTHWSPFPALPD